MTYAGAPLAPYVISGILRDFTPALNPDFGEQPDSDDRGFVANLIDTDALPGALCLRRGEPAARTAPAAYWRHISCMGARPLFAGPCVAANGSPLRQRAACQISCLDSGRNHAAADALDAGCSSTQLCSTCALIRPCAYTVYIGPRTGTNTTHGRSVFLDWWANHTGPRQTGYQAPLAVNPATGLREFHSGEFWPLDGAQLSGFNHPLLRLSLHLRTRGYMTGWWGAGCCNTQMSLGIRIFHLRVRPTFIVRNNFSALRPVVIRPASGVSPRWAI